MQTASIIGVFVVIVVLIIWAGLSLSRMRITNLPEGKHAHKKGDIVSFKAVLEGATSIDNILNGIENIWLVTGDHPQLGRPDKGGLNDAAAIKYALTLQEHGYENIQFIKQN